MEKLVVNGGRKVEGMVCVHGSKNSILPILAATILNSGESVIHNCPELRDVDAAVAILRYIGCEVKVEGNVITVNSKNAHNFNIPDEMMREMRSSVIFMGALLARFSEVSLCAPGGCELGARPIDLHISALRKLGAHIRETGGGISCKSSKLRGRDIVLAFPSVGATENIILAATACCGTTRIINAAREPEIEDLQNFLVSMGAEVFGAGSSTIVINGRKILHNTEYTVIPDRICAATFMAAAAACGGDVEISNVISEHVSTVVSLIAETGCTVIEKSGSVRVKSSGKLLPIRSVKTFPYPGFPTDAQPPIMAMTTKCIGTSMFVENIFDGRFRHAGELVRMGADIKIEGRVALVSGPKQLVGCPVYATDLRGGAALVIAGMTAEGITEIGNVEHIDRGYEKIERSMSAIGADIMRIEK